MNVFVWGYNCICCLGKATNVFVESTIRNIIFAMLVSILIVKVGLQLLQWKVHVDELESRHREKTNCSRDTSEKLYRELGLLQWWRRIAKAEEREERKGKGLDWDEWRSRVLNDWQRRFPGIPMDKAARLWDELCVLDRMTRPIQALAIQVRYREKEDVEMDVADVPKTPNPTPVSVKTESPGDKTLNEVNYPPDMSLSDAEEFKELQRKVVDLEKRVDLSTKELREHLARLDQQMYEDGVALVAMKWRTEELKEMETKEAGKRSYKKAKAKVPSHRYPTRQAMAQTEETLELSKKEFGDIEGKIKTMEEKMEELKKETDRLREELARAEALAPKVDALSTSLDSF